MILNLTVLRAPVAINNRTASKIGLALALIHLVAFVMLALYVRRLVDPQAPLLLAVFVVIDFPISLVDMLVASLHLDLSALERGGFVELLYPPYFIHGVLGTLWWYFLPRLVTPRRLGGIW